MYRVILVCIKSSISDMEYPEKKNEISCQKCKPNYISSSLSCIMPNVEITCFYRKQCMCEEYFSAAANVSFLDNAMINGNDKPSYLFLTFHFSFRYISVVS